MVHVYFHMHSMSYIRQKQTNSPSQWSFMTWPNGLWKHAHIHPYNPIIPYIHSPLHVPVCHCRGRLTNGTVGRPASLLTRVLTHACLELYQMYYWLIAFIMTQTNSMVIYDLAQWSLETFIHSFLAPGWSHASSGHAGQPDVTPLTP